MGIEVGTAALIAGLAGAGASAAGSIINAKKSSGGIQGTGYQKIPAAPPTAMFPAQQAEYMKLLTGTGGYGQQGLATLGQMSATGMPTDIGPAFEAMKAARAQQEAQGRSNILEQFGASGLRFSGPLMGALSNYEGQLGKDYMSILADWSMKAQEAARGRQMQAGAYLSSAYQEPLFNYYPSEYLVGPPNQSATGAGLSTLGNSLQYLGLLGMLFGGGGGGGSYNLQGAQAGISATPSLGNWYGGNPVPWVPPTMNWGPPS